MALTDREQALNLERWAELAREFEHEDSELAEMGMTEYAVLLEDKGKNELNEF